MMFELIEPYFGLCVCVVDDLTVDFVNQIRFFNSLNLLNGNFFGVLFRWHRLPLFVD